MELNLKKAAVKAEAEVIVEALKLNNNNKSNAAKALGIDRKTLYNKLASARAMGVELLFTLD